MNKKLGILLGIIVLLLCITSCKKGNVMNDYPNIEDKNHVFEELEINDVLKKLENKKSFYLILGFPECPWCQAIMPVLNDVAKDNKVKTIYYINIKQIRDNSEAVGHNEYKQLEENYFKDALDVEKNRLNTVYKMLKKKFDFKTISEITGLSLKEIKYLSKNLDY